MQSTNVTGYFSLLTLIFNKNKTIVESYMFYTWHIKVPSFFFFFLFFLSENNIAFNGAADGICYSRGEVQKRYRVATPTLKRSLSTRGISIQRLRIFCRPFLEYQTDPRSSTVQLCIAEQYIFAYSCSTAIVLTFFLFLFFLSL